MIPRLVLFGCAVALMGCGEEKPKPKRASAPELARFWSKEDLAGAVSVAAAKAAAPKPKVVVEGRISAFVKGAAAFKLVDLSLPYCGSAPGKMDECPTPWDYCCENPDELAAKTLLVEARDASGQPIPTASVEGLRLLDLVAVEGELLTLEGGSVVLAATAWHRRERPQLRDGLDWPDE